MRRCEAWRRLQTWGKKMSEQPPVYAIRFKGHLDARRAQMFEGLQIVQEPDGDTVLTGPVIDQAALHGLLDRIRDLGLPLLSVRQLGQAEVGAEKNDAG
jgi:predicted lipoprotein